MKGSAGWLTNTRPDYVLLRLCINSPVCGPLVFCHKVPAFYPKALDWEKLVCETLAGFDNALVTMDTTGGNRCDCVLAHIQVYSSLPPWFQMHLDKLTLVVFFQYRWCFSWFKHSYNILLTLQESDKPACYQGLCRMRTHLSFGWLK